MFVGGILGTIPILAFNYHACVPSTRAENSS